MGLVLSFYGLLALLAGYLLGSIPFGLLLTRAAGLGDVRNIGSGNIGATNVLRTGHKGLAAATLVELGLHKTADLVGGFQAWEGAGLPIEPGPDVHYRGEDITQPQVPQAGSAT